MNDATAPATPPRSNFVTVVAWVFICLGAGLTLLGALQAVIFSAIPMKEVEQMMNGGHGGMPMPMPDYTRFMFSHAGLYVAVSLVGAVALFAFSIGLLKRKRWARPAMAVLLALGAIRSLVSAALAASYYAAMPAPIHTMTSAPHDGEADAMFNSMMQMSMLVSVGFSLVVVALLVWIVVRLLSAKVRAEFEPVAAETPDTPDAPDTLA